MRMMKKFVLVPLVFTIAVVCPLLIYFKADRSVTSNDNEMKRDSLHGNTNIIIESNPETVINQDSGILSVVEMGKRIHSTTNDTVLVTLINDAYMSFTYSWLCNTKYMDIHKQVLFITTDTVSRDKLHKDWPEVSAVTLSGLSLSGDQVYSHAGYVRLMVRRTEALLAMLNANLEIFLFEVDCLWIRNPLPVLKKTAKQYDILVTPVSERPGIIAGGFLFMRPTTAMKVTWRALVDKLYNLDTRLKKLPPNQVISEGDNDQQFLSALIMSRYKGIQYKMLTLQVYPDGKWYSYPESKQKQLDPDIINNNWALGNKVKIDRAKKWHHWFIKEDNVTCDMDEVRKIVKN
ncbi:uncharacterized protein LOC110463819 [Mizuhopecten yessoensis]|uniref:Nucleotide-diphospho-sugar transferase domain-containing protein n=1 Tax=Mizuhopecten yessoensis TaxID=6573 RepID=A0A210PV86_MIZYE|nr:uncharacterized protein LOC110463819 [Mizuhopecten yessoensis]XP_021374373.1 uncharacterized protein LOC110463819 [Mizuhopecten yessoensis]OWF40399.1 hypothetical protein KP79_PYT16132 [Mizuhopecten yessoensis]